MNYFTGLYFSPPLTDLCFNFQLCVSEQLYKGEMRGALYSVMIAKYFLEMLLFFVLAYGKE